MAAATAADKTLRPPGCETCGEWNVSERFDDGLRQNVGFTFVLQTSHPPVCVRDVKYVSRQHTVRGCLWGSPNILYQRQPQAGLGDIL